MQPEPPPVSTKPSIEAHRKVGFMYQESEQPYPDCGLRRRTSVEARPGRRLVDLQHLVPVVVEDLDRDLDLSGARKERQMAIAQRMQAFGVSHPSLNSLRGVIVGVALAGTATFGSVMLPSRHFVIRRSGALVR